MAAKITNNGRTHVGERIQNSLTGAAITKTFAAIQIGTGTAAPTVSDTGVQTPLLTGGTVACTAGWPKIVTLAGGPAIEFKATFAAGTFTTGTAITEAAVRESLSVPGQCFGRGLLDTPKNPSASEPLDITIQFPIVAV
jgi:hypothetical protein